MNKFNIIFLFLIFISCNNSKKSSENQVHHSEVKVEINDETFRLIVSFISKASGPDQSANQLFLDFVNFFSTKNNVKIVYEKYPWGREGESDYCFKLNELSKEKQIEFIKELKAKLTVSDRVLFEENAACRHKK